MPGFAASGADSFLGVFTRLINSGEDSGDVGNWLLRNAGAMKDEIFLDRESLWQNLEPFHALALRAVAPSGVFTDKSRGAFLKAVGNFADLSGLAGIMFADDYTFANSLPAEMRPQVVALMKMAYSAGIRPGNTRVRNM